MEKDKKTKLIISQYDNTMQWEADYSDATVEDLLDAFYGCMVGLTFLPECVIKTMHEWSSEKLESFKLESFDHE